MQQLSVIIITLNEEKNIGRCLESIKDIADDIVVVDTFSKDATERICRQYKVNFIQREWQSFSSDKNFANSQAKYDYVFSIDADEALSNQLKNTILSAKKQGFDGIYKMNRLTNYCGKWIKHCGWYPDTKIRIWNRNEGRWEGKIHETIHFKKKQTTHFLKGDLLHYSFYSIEQHRQHVKKLSTDAAEDLFKRGKKSYIFKLLFSPVFTFIKNYFFHLGFLDGYYGFIVCKLSAYTTFLKYYKLQQLLKQSH